MATPTKIAPAPTVTPAGVVAGSSSTRVTRLETESAAVRAEAAKTTAASASAAAATPPPGSNTPADSVGIIQQVLDTFELGHAVANDGTSLAQWAWNQVVAQGLDPTTADPTALNDDIFVNLRNTDAFKQRFSGIVQQEALRENPTTPADYLAIEDTARGLATQYGLNPDIIVTPDTVASWVVGKASPSEISNRFNTFVDAYESAPDQVKQAYNQFYGTNDLTAFVAHVTNLNVTDDQLKQQMESAQIQGAGAALSLNVGQSRAEKLATMGVSYSTALNALQKVTAESGLYTPTVGEAQSSTGPGGSKPVTANDQGIDAALGLSATADQDVEREKLARQNSVRGGGGAVESANVGAIGAGPANSA